MADYTDVIASLLGGGLAVPPGQGASAFSLPPVGGGGSAFGLPAVGGGSAFELPAVLGGSAFELPSVASGATGYPLSAVRDTRKEQAAALEAANQKAVKVPGRSGGPAPADVPAAWRPTLEQAASQYGVDPTLLAAQLKQENNFQASGTSPAGARGAAQFMPATAAAYGVDVNDPHSSIRGQAHYMADLLQRYNGDQTLALVAYNGGDGAVQAWRAGRPYAESTEYVNRVTANQQAYRAQNAAQSNAAVAQGQAQSQAATAPVLAAAAAPVNNGYVFPVVGYRGAIALHHGGVAGGSDLMAPEGTPVVAMRAGTVTLAGNAGPGGNAVQIQGDDGLSYYYAHLQAAPQVRRGQSVQAGTPLGAVGRTGNAASTPAHLHIGIGPSIQEGVGPSGGTGGSYNAVALLQQAYGAGPGP